MSAHSGQNSFDDGGKGVNASIEHS
jgi:hypothetical protein